MNVDLRTNTVPSVVRTAVGEANISRAILVI